MPDIIGFLNLDTLNVRNYTNVFAFASYIAREMVNTVQTLAWNNGKSDSLFCLVNNMTDNDHETHWVCRVITIEPLLGQKTLTYCQMEPGLHITMTSVWAWRRLKSPASRLDNLIKHLLPIFCHLGISGSMLPDNSYCFNVYFYITTQHLLSSVM